MAAEVGDSAAAVAAAAAAGESRKLFVGGIPSSAQEGELRGHFARFGAVRSVVVMRDRETGHGRGFGFVEFEGEDAAAKALGDGEKPKHFICGREVDVRRARVRPLRNFGEQPVHHHQPEQGQDQGHQDNQTAGNGVVDGDDSASYSSKKVFVGGLRDNITEDEFRAYFEAFGTVTDVVVIYDSLTNRSRGFGFVTFDSEEAVRKVMGKSFHDLKGTRVEAKIAIPKDAHYYRNGRGRGSRPFGMGGPASYEGLFRPYNDRHGFYNGFMPQHVPAPPYYPGLYVGMGGYPYANAYPNQGVMPNVPSMVARRPVYSPYPPMYPGYGFPYRAGYAGPTFQHGVNGGSGYNNDQASLDVQELDSASTVATKFEYMKLGSQ
ncbi:heterogeneous nuclear ribonucleoprotein 1 [Brachypodium distachyon]|uniref:RRM domain-containing protein n=1 Tax=Brachypodium distachyon TaxID=15368 RepID=I1H3S4_BRADI|nr:heterogeneous nuclear ribonucleoprotein 1 [Brachypodium distachyon]KQK20921.1 hypothetical protein BRADI_1g57570v3 [Brachypodium distachyon]|eukprot:XP_003561433.1 heterogeneous nuclear ribonucleoprotein 1 [Brachypodium distachyon]